MNFLHVKFRRLVNIVFKKEFLRLVISFTPLILAFVLTGIGFHWQDLDLNLKNRLIIIGFVLMFSQVILASILFQNDK